MDAQVIQRSGQNGWKKLSGSTLKLIAMFCMLLDHFGAVVVYRILLTEKIHSVNYQTLNVFYSILRNVGRTAFPIFCFLLVEGFFHTKSRIKYGINLLLFAVISEIPFDLAIYGKLNYNNQNVYFTLFIGLMVIISMDKMKEIMKSKSVLLLGCLNLIVLVAGCFLALILSSDYEFYGIILIAIFYVFRQNRVMAGLVGYLFFLWEYFCFPAFLFIQCYNGKRGLKGKYFFYLFYPGHLLLFYFLAVLLGLIGR